MLRGLNEIVKSCRDCETKTAACTDTTADCVSVCSSSNLVGQRTEWQTDCGVRTKGCPEHRLIARQTGLHLEGNDLQVSTAHGLRDRQKVLQGQM